MLQVVDYNTMLTEVQTLNGDTNINQVWVAFQCNYAIYSALSSKVCQIKEIKKSVTICAVLLTV